MNRPPGGVAGAQPLARYCPSISQWICRISLPAAAGVAGCVSSHVESPSLLILLQLPMTTWCSSTRVGTPDTEHGGLVERLFGMPGLNAPPWNDAPPYAFFCVPRTARSVVTTGRQTTWGFQETPLVDVRVADAVGCGFGFGLLVRVAVLVGVALRV